MHPESYNQIRKRKAIIGEQMKDCRLCPHQCGVNRLEGQTGVCGLDSMAYCFREMINLTEEPGLVPSHQVYFAGCNLKCGFCSVAEWNQNPRVVPAIETDDLLDKIEARRQQGAINLNLLGGEPTVSLYGILGLLEKIPQQTRIVWNSNMYYRNSVWDALDGLIDVYLADFKCGSNACSEKMLGVVDYLEIVQKNLILANLKADLYVRHVVLPGHTDCCSRPILEWIAENLPGTKVSLRFDYIPPVPAGDCPKGYLTEKQKQKIQEIAKQSDLNVVYNNE